MKYVVAYSSGLGAGSIYREEREYGDTIEDIVSSIECLPERFNTHGVVFINGYEIERQNWHKIKPKPTDEAPVVVTLHIAPQGGDTVMTAAKSGLSLLSGGLTAPLSFLGGSSILSMLGKIALSVGASLLMSALSKPPTPEKKKKSGDENKTASLEGNNLEAGASIPRVVGTHKIFPPFIASPLVDLVDGDEYVEAVMALAGPHKLEDIRAGEIDVTASQDISIETREGWPTDTAITSVTRQSYTDANQIQFSRHKFKVDSDVDLYDQVNPENSIPYWHAVSTRNKPDEFWLHFSMPSGLYDGDNTSDRIGIPLRIRFRKKGTTTWINMPELWYQSRQTKNIKFAIKFYWNSVFPGNSKPADKTGFIKAFGLTKPQPYASLYSPQWTADQYFRTTATTTFNSNSVLAGGNYTTTEVKNIVLSRDNAEVYFDGTFPKDVYEFSIKVGFAVPTPDSNYVIMNGTFDPFYYSWEGVGNQPFKPDNASGSVWANGKLLVTAGSKIYSSTDGITFSVVGDFSGLVPAPTLTDIVWTGSNYVAVGNNFFAYANAAATAWTTNTASFTTSVTAITYSGARAVAVGSGGKAYWSNSGTVGWSQVAVSTFTGNLTSVAFGAGLFVAVGAGGVIYTSANGTGWVARASGTVNGLNHIVWTGTQFVAVGDNGVALKSADGITWSALTTGVSVALYSVFKSGAGLLVAGGLGGTIITSADNGTTWTSRFSQSVDDIMSVNFNGTIYNAVMKNGYNAYSYDGITWKNDNTNWRIKPNQENRNSDIYLIRASSIWNEHPCPVPNNLALIAIKAKNRQLSAISTLASGYVKDWNGASWATWTTTSNPAAHFYDALTGSLNFDPLPTSLVDSSSLVAWRTRCATKGYETNGVIENKSLFSVLDMLAGCGYARTYHSEIWGVVQDDDKSAQAPVQVFSPKNSNGFKFSKTFAKPVDAFRISFKDKTNLYNDTQFIQYDTFGGNVPNVANPRIEQITYEGLVTQAEATKRGTFDLAQARLRATTYMLDVSLESILCRQGDLVAVQHDVLETQSGFSRILSKSVAAGLITGVTLYEQITVGAGPNSIAIRQFDGTIIVKSINETNGSFSAVTFVAPFADTSTIDDDALIVSGPSTSVYKRFIVTSIQPSTDYSATLTLVDEAPSLQTII